MTLKINGDLITQNIDGHQNVVTAVPWACEATVGKVTASVQGVVALAYNASSPFVQYPDLTQQEVLGWVTTALGGQPAVDFYNAVALEKATAADANPENKATFLFVTAVYQAPAQSQPAPWSN